jgi:hypothetical protein
MSFIDVPLKPFVEKSRSAESMIRVWVSCQRSSVILGVNFFHLSLSCSQVKATVPIAMTPEARTAAALCRRFSPAGLKARNRGINANQPAPMRIVVSTRSVRLNLTCRLLPLIV